MVIPFSNYMFSKPTGGPNRPIYNDFNFSNSTGAVMTGFTDRHRQFWNWYKNTPELQATINIFTTDVIGDTPSFLDLNGRQLSGDKKKTALDFWRANRCKEAIKAGILDGIITGDAYWWVGKVTEAQIKEVTEKISRLAFGNLLSKTQIKELSTKAALDEDLREFRKFDYIASSTVRIIHDNYEIKNYEQNSNGDVKVFDPTEVVHWRFITGDGKVNGFSPVLSMARELHLMWLVKGNMTAYLENGGRPDYLFTLENEKAGSPGYELFKQQLLSAKNIHTRHGNLLATGKVTAVSLNEQQKDLEYKDLALYITSNIAFLIGIPINRLPFLIGNAAVKGDGGGTGDTGYWNKVAETQDNIEDLLNYQAFEKLGWKIKLPRKYKQDMVREAQVLSMNVSSIQTAQQIYAKQGKKIIVEKLNEVLGISDDDLEDLTEKDKQDILGMTVDPGSQNRMDNKTIQKEPGNRAMAKTKQVKSATTQANNGIS